MRSLLARSLEPLMAISWGVFLIGSIWLTAVWALGINGQWLGLPVGGEAGWGTTVPVMVQDVPDPPNAGLRRAILLLADHAELAWLTLALIQVHLHVMRLHGVNVARVWLGVCVGGAFLLASANRAFGIPFGWLHFTRVLGAQFLGVPVAWVLLWAVLLIGSREGVARLWARGSHAGIATGAALVVVLTMANLHPIARDLRAWWFWHAGNVRVGAPAPWWFWLSLAVTAWVLLLMLRERTVVSAAARRSLKPLAVVGLLNLAALFARIIR